MRLGQADVGYIGVLRSIIIQTEVRFLDGAWMHAGAFLCFFGVHGNLSFMSGTHAMCLASVFCFVVFLFFTRVWCDPG